MYDHLLESSHRDDSNKWSNIGFGQEITQVALIEVNFTHLIWRSACKVLKELYLSSYIIISHNTHSFVTKQSLSMNLQALDNQHWGCSANCQPRSYIVRARDMVRIFISKRPIS